MDGFGFGMHCKALVEWKSLRARCMCYDKMICQELQSNGERHAQENRSAYVFVISCFCDFHTKLKATKSIKVSHSGPNPQD